MVGVKASGSPHVLELWLGVIKGMLSVTYFCSTMPLFCVIRIWWRSYDCCKNWVKSGHSQWILGDIARSMAVVSVLPWWLLLRLCLSYFFPWLFSLWCPIPWYTHRLVVPVCWSHPYFEASKLCILVWLAIRSHWHLGNQAAIDKNNPPLSA